MENPSLFKHVFEIIENYLKDNSSGKPVVEYRDPQKLFRELELKLPQKPGKMEDVLGWIEKYLKYSVRTANKQYFNQLWAGFTMPGFLGEVFSSLAATSMYTYEVAPVATLMERELLSKMCSLVGFENGDGLFVTGASNANLVSVLAARNNKIPSIKKDGYVVSSRKNLVMFVSGEAHYSFLKAANVCGIGMENVIRVKTDEKGRMIPGELDKAIELAKKGGMEPFFIGATAGTTVLGAFDPLEEIEEIARKHGVWLHIDGALGGSVVLSRKHRHLLKGAGKADSLGWNAHKMMGLPLVCSVILMKRKGILYDTAKTTSLDEQYIFHDNSLGEWDLGPKSLQCGRRVDALKLWLCWQYFGDEGFERRIDRLFELAEYAEERIKSNPKLELVAPRQSVTVCFRYVPEQKADINRFNIEIRDKLLKSGKSFVNYASLKDGKVAIRLALMNPELEFSDIDRFFDNVLLLGDE